MNMLLLVNQKISEFSSFYILPRLQKYENSDFSYQISSVKGKYDEIGDHWSAILRSAVIEWSGYTLISDGSRYMELGDVTVHLSAVIKRWMTSLVSSEYSDGAFVVTDRL